MDDKGNGAHFTPFREISEDDTNEHVREFRETTGCFTTYLNLTEDHETNRTLNGPAQQDGRRRAVQALVFYDANNDPDFIDNSFNALMHLMNNDARFKSNTEKSQGKRTNFVFDKDLSDDTARFEGGAVLPLDRVLNACSTKRALYYLFFRDEFASGYNDENGFVELPEDITTKFYSYPDLNSDLFFSKRTNGTYHDIAITFFGYPRIPT